MRKIPYLIYYWIPVFVWMELIFYMSSQKSVAKGINLVADFVTFKTLHMIEYAFLFFLLYRAFKSLSFFHINIVVVSSFLITLLYSLSDELHQLSIPTRSGQFRDIFFDVAGMLMMYGIIKKMRLFQKLL